MVLHIFQEFRFPPLHQPPFYSLSAFFGVFFVLFGKICRQRVRWHQVDQHLGKVASMQEMAEHGNHLLFKANGSCFSIYRCLLPLAPRCSRHPLIAHKIHYRVNKKYMIELWNPPTWHCWVGLGGLGWGFVRYYYQKRPSCYRKSRKTTHMHICTFFAVF